LTTPAQRWQLMNDSLPRIATIHQNSNSSAQRG